jgi:hypothetical protein
MATIANGVKIEQSGYEFGMRKKSDSVTIWYPDYHSAKEAAGIYGGQLRMRVLYRSEEMDTT